MDVQEIYWQNYDNRPVLIQLRAGAEYAGVTYPNDIITQRNAEGEIVGVVTTPFLRGVLRVKPNGKDGVLLVLQTNDPNPHSDGGVVDIVLHPDDVLYLSHVDKKILVQP
jgi:hypothetical protein